MKVPNNISEDRIEFKVKNNQGEEKMPKRSIAENQELGDKVEEGIVKDFANTVGKNLSRMSKTHVKINI